MDCKPCVVGGSANIITTTYIQMVNEDLINRFVFAETTCLIYIDVAKVTESIVYEQIICCICIYIHLFLVK